MYHTEPPTDKTIREWYMKFQQSGCLCAAKRTGHPGPSAETVECVREAFVRSPQKSTTRASRELQMSQSSVWRILRKRLRDKGSWRQSLLSTAKCCNACCRNLITGLTSAASPRVHISSTCKVGQKLGEILYLLICSFLPCLSWLLRSRVRKSRRDL